MKPGLVILVFIASIALISILVVAVFRYAVGRFGLGEITGDGFALTEAGIEIVHFFWFGKTLLKFTDVESAELLPFRNLVMAGLLFRYGISVRIICTRLFSDVIVIRLKSPPCFTKYVLITPKNPLYVMGQILRRTKNVTHRDCHLNDKHGL